MLPVFIGVGLGVMLGSIPLYVPGFPVALKLGLAGGPLIMALILGRIGSIGKLYWFMPPSANLALRELGIVLFLAVVGLKSGGDFVDTLVNGEGMSWVGYGIFITAIPLITVGLLARIFAKMNYLTLCGMLAGSMTALATLSVRASDRAVRPSQRESRHSLITRNSTPAAAITSA